MSIAEDKPEFSSYQVTDAQLRCFLLCQNINDGTRRKIERALSNSDMDLIERLDRIEELLIEEYLAGELGTVEQLCFQKNFMTNAARAAKLRFANERHVSGDAQFDDD